MKTNGSIELEKSFDDLGCPRMFLFEDSMRHSISTIVQLRGINTDSVTSAFGMERPPCQNTVVWKVHISDK